jgi:hypothetical protein
MSNVELTSALIDSVSGDPTARAAAAAAQGTASAALPAASFTSAGIEAVGVSRISGVPVSGVTVGQDAASAIEAAHATAKLIGADVVLPPYEVILSRPVRVNRLRGYPGLSKINVSNITMGSYPLSQFCLVNEHWATAYNTSTSDRCLFAGFELYSNPTHAHAMIGLANVSYVDVDQMVIRANRALDGSSKPYAIDSLLDFYSCVRGGYVRRSQFYQSTGAYGSTRVSAGGGGCIWVRNISADGTAANNITEEVLIEDNDFYHYTTDECVAFYGVRGVTRHNTLRKNRIWGLEAADLGLASSETIYRATLLSIFPLDDGSGVGLGNTAAVYENEFCDNEISDKSTLYNTIRFGNTPDAARRCENNRSRRNKVSFKYWSDATYGQTAVWTSAGASGTNPSTANIPIRCIEGTQGTAYSGVFSGNVSESDEVGTATGGTTITSAFSGWQLVRNGRTRGGLTSATQSCINIQGGCFESSLQVFVNCTNVSGVSSRINSASTTTHSHFAITTTIAGTYSFSNSSISAGGSVAYIGSAANASTIANVQGITGAIGSFPALSNNKTGAVLRANGNYVTGASAVSEGTGTFKKANNTWGATDE